MDATDASGEGDVNLAWAKDVGAQWLWVIVMLAIGCALAGWFFPLIDPDLPMHLRTGEWIVAEGRVPFEEPFSWTRPGAPFFAYSWLAELLYFGMFTLWGAAGLQAIHAATAAGVFLVIVALGRVSKWTPWSTLLVALMSFAVWIAFIAAVRPQALMGITVPLSWIGAELIARGRVRAGLALTVLAAFLTVNTHLLFPVTAMPVLRLMVEPSVSWRKVGGLLTANAIGWMLTPYAFVFVEMMRINFSGNALIGPATSVTELEAGFKALMHTSISIRIAVVILLLVPFVIPSKSLTDRERFWYGLAWLGGLFLFGSAIRGVVIWLLAALPLLARAASGIPLPQLDRTRRITVGATLLVPLGLLGGEWNQRNHFPQVHATMETRLLPVTHSAVLEPLVRFVECHLEYAPSTKAYTAFNYGSYLVWRLPTLSYSIDGRNIYPDSVAAAEAFQTANGGIMQLGPWRSADIAIAPLAHATALAINASPEWQLLRVSIPTDTTGRPGGLWAKRAWISTHVDGSQSLTADTVPAPRMVVTQAPCGGV